ncbi:MAG TPA: PP2C family protein-serine/threonine phosphatase [Candidatus Solibacter sp.]|nr:PP2C family protein-serine/threonine phosphatase [Candidatus Solibacter sp.]
MTSEELVVDVSQDWAGACDVQQGFMHCLAPALDALSYGARCRQLRELGGDCYDSLPLPGNCVAFAIGDASGKSLPAALMIANVQSSLRTAASFAGQDPAAVLDTVNRQVNASCLADRFATLFYGVFDPATRTLRYANAGHNPPLVLRQDSSIAWLDSASFPLGIFRDSRYEESAVQLQRGDTLIAYTDGVIEAVNQSGEEWGLEGITKAALHCNAKDAGELVDALFASLDDFSRGRQTDDATILVARVH